MLPKSPDYPVANAYWQPAHANNYGTESTVYRLRNEPVAIVLHTPEEDADDREITPQWFQNPLARASTHYYADSDGDIIQMVRDHDCAFAQGVNAAQAIRPYPSWHDPARLSYNTQALSIEIEGRAASIHHTMKIGGHQWQSLVAWIGYKAKQYNIPLDRAHIIGHSEIANHKSDPGAQFPWDALMRALIDAQVKPLSLTNARWTDHVAALRRKIPVARVTQDRVYYELWYPRKDD